jgi:pyrroline-5-carboxylate reductase
MLQLAQSTVMETPTDFTITFLGCGTLGTAILTGVLSALSQHQMNGTPGTATPNPLLPTRFYDATPCPPILPNTFLACVKRRESALRVQKALSELALGKRVEVLVSENVRGATLANIVVLGCKPQMCEEVLTAPGMAEALDGKLLVSICAGVRMDVLRGWVPEGCRIVRAMPNTASKVFSLIFLLLIFHAVGGRLIKNELIGGGGD